MKRFNPKEVTTPFRVFLFEASLMKIFYLEVFSRESPVKFFSINDK